MPKTIACGLLLAMIAVMGGRAEAAPIAPERNPGFSSIIPVQDWRHHCRRLRYEIRDIEARIAYAPPWERPRLSRRLEHRRREFWRDCRR